MRYVFGILGVLVLIITLSPNLFEELSEFDLTIQIDVENQDCDSLADMLIGLELQNVFGAKSEIVAIRERVEKTRSETSLICEGKILASSGMRVVEDYFLEVDGDQYFYGVGAH